MTEQTLGKRIATNRKTLGLTQDALAEKLGVTAQAVSKWENDQSCPDIAMLPKLAEIFGITIDALLGVERKEEEKPGLPEPAAREPANSVVLQPGSRVGIGIALWMLLTGAVRAAMTLFSGHPISIGFWQTACLTALVVFGLTGLYPRFRFFRLGCGLLGGYYLYCGTLHPAVHLNEELLLPLVLLFFGLGLLVDSIRGKTVPRGHLAIDAAGKNIFSCEGNAFVCSTFFGDDHRIICLPVLERGEGSVMFGELTIDLHDCGDISGDCSIALKCIFGTLTLFVPRQWRVQCVNKTAFGVVQEYGAANPDGGKTLYLHNDVAFGEISIKYI